MPKVKIGDYDATAANNTDINSIDIDEGWAPSVVNNAFRELLSQMADAYAGDQAWDSITTGITAGSTQSQAGSTELTTTLNNVTVSGTDGDGVKLPPAVAGLLCYIKNSDSAQTIQIWPNTSDTVDGGSANAVAANALSAGAVRLYMAVDGTDWVTITNTAAGIGLGTGDSPQFTGIELGHASDTTIARASAGEISVEGAQLAKLDGNLQDLDTLGAASSDGEIAVATGAGALAWESGATLRTSVGVGTGDSPAFAGLDVNGGELVLDADGDTSVTADTDDTIDVRIAGADDFQFTANTLSVLSGSTLNIDSGATIANSGTATGFGGGGAYDLNGGELTLDADADTSITADSDDQIDFEIAGADDFQMTANLFTALSGSTINQVNGALSVGASPSSAGVTLGLILDGAAADNNVIELKSSDVAHGMTDLDETDTHAAIRKAVATQGGFHLAAYGEGYLTIELEANSTSAETADTSTSDGPVEINNRFKSGASITDMGATSNMALFKNNGTCRWLIKGNGDVHQTTDAHTALDAHDDVAMLRTMDSVLSPEDVVRKRHDDWLVGNRTMLEDIGLLGRVTPEEQAQGVTPLINVTRERQLVVGGLCQLRAMLEEIKAAGDEMLPGFAAKVNERLAAQQLPALPV